MDYLTLFIRLLVLQSIYKGTVESAAIVTADVIGYEPADDHTKNAAVYGQVSEEMLSIANVTLSAETEDPPQQLDVTTEQAVPDIGGTIQPGYNEAEDKDVSRQEIIAMFKIMFLTMLKGASVLATIYLLSVSFFTLWDTFNGDVVNRTINKLFNRGCKGVESDVKYKNLESIEGA